MKTHNLGYPRIGSNRELKKANEQYWSGEITHAELLRKGRHIAEQNWLLQQKAGIDLIPSNDFSYYDQVLDMSLTVGAIPKRYNQVILKTNQELDLYFAMARGYQKDGLDITAMEMTKWLDTNYHYIVPEFYKGQEFSLFSGKIANDFLCAKQLGINSKPVIIGPVSYLLLGKEKEAGFDKLDLIKKLLPVYLQILGELKTHGAEWIQFDEPFLGLDINDKVKEAYKYVYAEIKKQFPHLKILVATYFEGLKDNLVLATSLPVKALHIDLVRCPEQLDAVLDAIPAHLILSLGVVDGRNIWKNDFEQSLKFIQNAVNKLGSERIFIAPSCSLLHSPCDLDLETNEITLTPEIKQWLAFAKQKIDEVVTLKALASENTDEAILALLDQNKSAIESRKTSKLIHNQQVKQRVNSITEKYSERSNPFSIRKIAQKDILNLPLFPTTTIGSFPQTAEVRNWRAQFKKNEVLMCWCTVSLSGTIWLNISASN
jgi:5-methyltetrahydropteroyltriglutamate--homocysteine methyltransferase